MAYLQGDAEGAKRGHCRPLWKIGVSLYFAGRNTARRGGDAGQGLPIRAPSRGRRMPAKPSAFQPRAEQGRRVDRARGASELTGKIRHHTATKTSRDNGWVISRWH